MPCARSLRLRGGVSSPLWAAAEERKGQASVLVRNEAPVPASPAPGAGLISGGQAQGLRTKLFSSESVDTADLLSDGCWSESPTRLPRSLRRLRSEGTVPKGHRAGGRTAKGWNFLSAFHVEFWDLLFF